MTLRVIPQPFAGGLAEGAGREGRNQCLLKPVALLPKGNGDASEPESRPQQTRHALLDGLTAMTSFLVLFFPVAFSGCRRKEG